MREDLLKGKCSYPGIRILEKYPDKAHVIEDFWQSLWWAYLDDQELNGIYWIKELGPDLYNDLVILLDQHGWVHSEANKGRKWISITLLPDNFIEEGHVTKAELLAIKKKYKFSKYKLNYTESRNASYVKTSVGSIQTGLVRTGFMKAGDTEFTFDRNMLEKYEEAITKNANKAMEKVLKEYPDVHSETSYDSTVEECMKHYKYSTETYTTGTSRIDSRGRAISKVLGKVGNPIADKNFRSLLVCR